MCSLTSVNQAGQTGFIRVDGHNDDDDDDDDDDNDNDYNYDQDDNGLVRLKLCELPAVHDGQKRTLTLFCFTLSLILDNERWKQADVPSELQSLVNSLVDGKQYMNLRFSQVYMDSFSPICFLEH